MYGYRHTTNKMRWHYTDRPNEENVLRYPADGKAWKDFDINFPAFANEPRNVRSGLASDDFNPFRNISLSYTMWPMVFTTYNLPPWLCMKNSYFMSTLLIPGPPAPDKDMDVFL